MIENRESATGKDPSIKKSLLPPFPLFLFFCCWSLYIPQWKSRATYILQYTLCLQPMVYGPILGGVGIGTRDFRLTMACSGHPTNDSIALFPSAAFFMPDVWLSTTHKSLNSKRTTNSNNTLPSSGRNLLFKHQAATDSNSARQPTSTELTAGRGTRLERQADVHSKHT